MMRDLSTVIWKEWREFRDQLFKIKRGGLSAIIVVVLLGLITPLQLGPPWISSPLMLFYWPFLAGSMVSTLIADAIAGERERHTLETLLATRLPDASILLGKVVAAVMYGYVFVVMNLIVGLVALNIRYRENGVLFFSGMHLLSLFVLVGANCFFLSGIGVFVSLRSSTVRQAQQAFGIIMLVLFMAPVLAIQMVSPNRVEQVKLQLTTVGVYSVALWVGLALSVAALLVNLAALVRFRRGRLVLD
jgi:ABC-2 type transport system permease protein